MALKHEKPNPALMAELIEVRDATQELDDRLTVTNWLPDNFEREALITMLNTLRALPKGTAFAAQSQFKGGQGRAAKYRRNLFQDGLRRY